MTIDGIGVNLKHKRKSKGRKKTCDVKGCDGKKKKSVPASKAKNKAGLDVETDSSNAYLCKKHWKKYKKATKEDREMRQLGWD
ncbi:MAG: hypothetical protein R6U61_02900 [Thermoplasmata archaeon]